MNILKKYKKLPFVEKTIETKNGYYIYGFKTLYSEKENKKFRIKTYVSKEETNKEVLEDLFEIFKDKGIRLYL